MYQSSPIRFPSKYAAQRGRQRPSDIPIPTTATWEPHGRLVPNASRNGPAGNPGLRIANTLVRPERRVAVAPLINPPTPTAPSGGGILPSNNASARPVEPWDAWRMFSRVLTFWAPTFLLSTLGRMKDKPTRQAWREKVALCMIAVVLGVTMGFSTAFLDRIFCPTSSGINGSQFLLVNTTETKGLVSINGYLFNTTNANTTLFNYSEAVKNFGGVDITPNFTRTAAQFTSCSNLSFKAAKDEPCPNPTSCVLPPISTATIAQQKLTNTTFPVGYDWSEVGALEYYLVINGFVLNFAPYFARNPNPIPTDAVDAALRTVLKERPLSGKDATRLFSGSQTLSNAYPCLLERYYAGHIDRTPPRCLITSLFMYTYFVITACIVLARFLMATTFNWYLSHRLVKAPKNLGRKVIFPVAMPQLANNTVDYRSGTALWAGASNKEVAKHHSWVPDLKGMQSVKRLSGRNVRQAAEPVLSMATIGRELFCVCLVTCYSEGRSLIQATLDSIALTNYSDSRKLILVVCDGLITGAGEMQSTPDICVSLLDADPRFGDPVPMGYTSVGLGSKKENRAMVYAGHYVVKNRRTPTIIIVKCGMEAEAASEKKPGNRGKRDSQLVMMNFFSRITYKDPFSPLDYDMFRKIRVLMGVTPDLFEVTLMVDADTRVDPDAIQQLVNCMHNDKYITGVCGETRLANSGQSWVTAIQVYEYFLSHHFAKAFESVFGGVTCLPGCFSMYRLKARKADDDDWIPLITKREIIREYSQSEVTTLHQKNLLLLGEDRFLTTIMLRAFPNRKMMFCPHARCHTLAPDTFSVLLSQRRRWINSTVHSLMELVLVRNLCGTFCFSMQFILFTDLVGTAILPVSISLTYYLIVAMAINPPQNFQQTLPLLMMCTAIGVPGLLVAIATRKVSSFFWMLIYFAALPIWTLVLPLYAFWHFDDFTWGQTRLVEGEGKQKAHDTTNATLVERTLVPFRRWEDWEQSRVRMLQREARKKRDMDDTDNSSLAPSDDARWDAHISGYDENSSQWERPPDTLMTDEQLLQSFDNRDFSVYFLEYLCEEK